MLYVIYEKEINKNLPIIGNPIIGVTDREEYAAYYKTKFSNVTYRAIFDFVGINDGHYEESYDYYLCTIYVNTFPAGEITTQKIFLNTDDHLDKVNKVFKSDISHEMYFVIIEAMSEKEAIKKAEEVFINYKANEGSDSQ